MVLSVAPPISKDEGDSSLVLQNCIYIQTCSEFIAVSCQLFNYEAAIIITFISGLCNLQST